MSRLGLPLILSTLALAACEQGVNIFTLEDDRELGAQLHDEILANPADYPLLDEAEHPEAYDHLNRVHDAIMDSGEVTRADDFDWQVYIIDDPDTLNAFAAPGGYTYYYSGLILYLEQEDHFAGVMAHEMAHVDRRHSTQQLTQAYGVATLVDIVLGEDTGILADVAESLVSMSFSRSDENEADEYSVRFLCETDYAADGAAGFFEKLLEGGGMELPAFLSTHPNSQDRVDHVHELAAELGCSTEPNPDADYEAFQASLP